MEVEEIRELADKVYRNPRYLADLQRQEQQQQQTHQQGAEEPWNVYFSAEKARYFLTDIDGNAVWLLKAATNTPYKCTRV